MTPTLPPEFFSPAELGAMAGTPQRGRIVAWLRDCGIPHVIGLHRWPLVYRTRLLPTTALEEQNERPKFDFSAARATSRKTA